MSREHKRGGFTLIELMLAMAFISVLLLAIALTAIHVGRIYNKGLVIQSVNQAGRDVGDILRRDFLQTDARSVSGSGGDRVIMISDTSQQRSGRFCLGGYSYIWNTPQALSAERQSRGSASGGLVVDQSGEPISFVRVVDEGGALCQQNPTGGYQLTLPTNDRVTHLLKRQSDSEVVLGVYSLSVSPVVLLPDSSEGLYRLKFTLGTSEVSEINTASQSCRPPSDSQANDDFCAINQFEMIVRTNG
ncbi:hypothetical protein B7Z00_00115 [Candidatus Saccharibacteria bacterium 32-50-10]|nr:MAG: hypothetical protein B7Z00_00115 [Candidatus Saccharibacteria bacterium 32-50-10]